jgi:hypothetical protein
LLGKSFGTNGGADTPPFVQNGCGRLLTVISIQRKDIMANQGNTTCLGRGRHRWGAFFLLLLGLLVAGCGSKGTISGRVLYQGKPVPGGTVIFVTKDKGAMRCPISAEGNYTIEKVPAGEVKIVVLDREMSKSGKLKMVEKAVRSGMVKKEQLPPDIKKELESSSTASGQPIRIPANYADADKSGLACTVTGSTQTYDIELK